ncbi:MAG: zinc ribbon domain-containing protein [Eubacteriales bacterium]
MALLDDIANMLTQASQSTVQKTKDMSEVSKINSLILAEENKVKNYHTIIGQKYMKQVEEDSIDLFPEETKGVLEATEKIKKYRQQIKEIRGVQQCSNCTADVVKGAVFCAFCGTPVEVLEEKVPIVDLVADEPVIQHVEYRA